MKQFDPNHIPGIYIWCDRWCERCKMTSKCYLYAQEQADNLSWKVTLIMKDAYKFIQQGFDENC